jgi:hypothetical protein
MLKNTIKSIDRTFSIAPMLDWFDSCLSCCYLIGSILRGSLWVPALFFWLYGSPLVLHFYLIKYEVVYGQKIFNPSCVNPIFFGSG